MCCWARVTGVGSSATANGIITQHGHLTGGLGITMKDISSTDLRMSVNTGLYGDSGGSDRTYCTYYGNTNIYNQWHHLCITYQSSTKQLRMYVDGKLDRDVITLNGNSAVARPFALFAWSTDHLYAPDYRPPCELNDVRLYDHLLSVKEIKEISKGLVAHYQLKGMGRTNYLKGADKYTRENPLIRKASDSSARNDSYIYYGDQMNLIIPVQDTYTFVLDCDGVPSGHETGSGSGNLRRFNFFVQHRTTGTHTCFGSWGTGSDGKKWGSMTLPAGEYQIRSNLYSSDNVDYTVKFWNIKVVQGNYEPDDPYCPHEQDGRFKDFGLDTLNETDVSGNGNHARQSAIFKVEGDSPRYSSCYKFDGSKYLICGRGPMVRDAITVSCWGYMDNWGDYTNRRLLSCTEGGGWNLEPGGENSSNGMNFAVGTGTTSNTYHSATANIACSSMSPGWHMITGTYDGYTTKIYIDGVHRGSSASKSSKTPIFYNSGNGIFIGAEAAGSSTTPGGQYFNGKISDVRIYGTALSAADIVELYENSASLAKNGTLFAYEFCENKKSSITKNGICSNDNITNKKAPIQDMKVKALGDGSTWARINYLDVSKDNIYFSSAEVDNCTDKHNRYSRMNIADKFKAGGSYEFMLTYPTTQKKFPAGYTKLEYIEATGTQWINTGVTGHARWEFDIQFTNTTKRQLMGYYGNGDEYWGVQTDGKYGLFAGSTIGTAGKRDIVVHDYQLNAATLWAQNQTMGCGGTTSIGSNQYQLFTIMNAAGYQCHAKLWRCRCVQSGSLIRDFIPAMRNSDGAIGLLDIVNNVFYGNSGSGGFYCNYSWLEYIESTGTQWINTGVVAKSTLKSQLKFNMTVATGGVIYGDTSSGDNNDYRFFNASSICYLDFPDGLRIYGGNIYAGTDYEVEIGNYYVKNMATNTNIVSGSAASFSDRSYTLKLFYEGGGISKGKIYYLKIYDNGTLIRDFVPCLNNNTPGLLDKVSGAFYGNSGSGTFKYAYKSKRKKYQWLDYIESTGTQWIDTGVSAPEGFIFDGEWLYTTTGGSYIVGSHNEGSPYGRNGVGSVSNTYWELGTGDTCPASSTAISLNTKYQLYGSTVKGNSYLNVNGSRVITTSDSSSRSSYNVLLFTNQYSRYYGHGGAIGRLYSMKIYKSNGTLVRDFVPCVNPYGEVGMYDKVTGGFFGNSGTGYFRAGTTREPLPMYNRWVQTSSPSSGTVSGFKPIETAWTAHHAGIRNMGGSAKYNCDTGGTWYAAIGQYGQWDAAGGLYIPGADGGNHRSTELWIRTDRLSNETQLNIYKEMTTAKDFIEF